MDFLARLYEKFKEYDNNDNADEKKNNNRYGFFDTLIDLMISILKDEKSSKGLNAMECFSKSQEMLLRRPQSLKLYFETLNEFSEDVRKQIIQQEKCVLEYNMLISQPPKDWQKIWFDNIKKYDKIILYGKCQNKECSSHGPVIYDYYGYRKAISQSTDNRYSKTKCTQCNAENALHVYYSMDNFDI
ncbi:MAG TPA: hypothetical protein VFI70_01575 [Nitrososphaeraceae archaeon]|nr:hypothetical protein [Nitrososphaeraceae archaeon]